MKLHYIIIKLRILSLLLLLPLTFPCLGQSGNSLNTNSLNNPGKTDPAWLINNQIDYIRNSYSEKIVAPKELINGKEYESYYNRSTSKPLLFPKKKRTAVLLTTSRKYTNLTLDYDTFLDEVIYTDTSRTFNYTFPKIALNNNIIDGFTLYFEDDSMNFKYLRPLQSPHQNLKEGFYEIAYEGKSRYIIKHTSSFYVRDGLNEYKYSPENYVSTGGEFFEVSGKGSLLKLFGDKSAEVKKFIHSSRIRIRQAGKNEFISILKYYDSLTNAQ